MSKTNGMTVPDTMEEIKFALKHKIDFFKHNVDYLLEDYEARKVCDELGVSVEVEAICNSNPIRERACYSMKFGKNGSSIATYFTNDLVTSDNNYKYNPNSEEEE